MKLQQLQSEFDALDAQVASLQSERDRVTRELALCMEKRELIRRLMTLERGGQEAVEQVLSAGFTDEHGSRDKLAVRDGSKPFEDEVYAILKRHAKPVHISQIRTALIHQGVPIPGKGADANIISRILRDGRIQRMEGRRGYYSVKEKG